MRAHPIRIVALLCLLVPLLSPGRTSADEVPGAWPQDALPDDALLTGKEIYRRVLRNRLHSYEQDTRIVSGDRGGFTQQTELTVHFQSFKDENDQPTDGIQSKTRLEYTQPFDLRHTTYLVIDKANATNDQFVYLPTFRRIRRVNLRGEAVFGSDFSFEDVLPRELEDAEYKRLPDQTLDGVPCFAVEATPNPTANSEYSRFQFLIEKKRYVPLQIHYWNEAGVLFKELRADYDSIELFDTAWIPTRSKMSNLLQESWSKLDVVKLIPNPPLSQAIFSIRRLESR